MNKKNPMTAPGPDWDARYARPDYVYGTEPNAFLKRETVRLDKQGEALCVADGEGRNSVWLAQQGFRVHAVEASPVALGKARALAAKAGVTDAIRFEQADLLHWDWPRERYQSVVAIFIQFAGPEARAGLFEAMKTALVPGGVLLLQGYRPEQIAFGTGGPGTVDNLYTPAMLRDAFADFEIVQLTSHDAEIHEGKGHNGMSALIDLIAKRPMP